MLVVALVFVELEGCVFQSTKKDHTKKVSLAPSSSSSPSIIKPSIGGRLSDWKTYRNEDFGLEIDYPTVGWELKVHLLGTPELLALSLQKLANGEKEESHTPFYVYGTVYFMSSVCKDWGWEKIINSIFECTDEQIYSMNYEKEITTNSGTRGYQIEVKDARGKMKGILFPISGLKWDGKEFPRACFLLTYYLEDPEPNPEEVEAFNQIASSFRFIKK